MSEVARNIEIVESEDACCGVDGGHHHHQHHHQGQVQYGGGEDVDSNLSLAHSRNEKKARKALAKLGLKRVPGITRVTLCRTKTVIFVIANPDVYKHPQSNSYVIFGEPKVEDLGLAAQAARNLKGAGGSGALPGDIESHLQEYAEKMGSQIGGPKKGTSDVALHDDDEDDSSPIDESGLDDKDISMLMEQTNVSRRKAVKTLRENDGDIVNSIMALSG